MKLREVIESIDRSSLTVCNGGSDLFTELGIDYPDGSVYHNMVMAARLKFISIIDWHCTDSTVGVDVYFLDYNFVGWSIQLGRKCDIEFEWDSRAAFLDVRNYVLSCIDNVEDEFNVSIVDLDQDLDGYKIQFCGQMYKHHFENEVTHVPSKCKCKIINREKPEKGKYDICQKVEIKFENGTTERVELDDILFPLNLK